MSNGFQLRTILVKLFQERETIERIIDEIDLPRGQISLTSSLKNTWHSVLIEADKQRIITKLLAVAVSEYPNQILDIAKARLKDLIYQIKLDNKSAKHLYLKSRADIFEGQKEVNSVEEIVSTLADMVDREDRQLPIIEFAERLAGQTENVEITIQLKEWSDWLVSTQKLRNVTDSVLNSLRLRLNRKQSGQGETSEQESYLLVEIWPDTKTRGKFHQRYWVNIYLWKAVNDIVCWHSQIDDASGHYNKSYHLDAIPKLIYDLLDEHEDESPNRIDFFLPFELLVEPVEQRQIEGTLGEKVALGRKFPIVVRSRDRLREKGFGNARREWRKKWKWFCKNEKRHVFWCHHSDQYDPQKLYDALDAAGEEGVCLGMTFSPYMQQYFEDQRNLLSFSILAGTPVIVWCHHGGDVTLNSNDFRRDLEKDVLCSHNLPKLPQVIFFLRQNAANGSAEHVGNHLALFWDDPKHLPPNPNQDMSNLI